MRADRFTWHPDDIVPSQTVRVSLSAGVQEFANKCHAKSDGKFCSTTGNQSINSELVAPKVSGSSAKAMNALLKKHGLTGHSVSKATSQSWSVKLSDGTVYKVKGGSSIEHVVKTGKPNDMPKPVQVKETTPKTNSKDPYERIVRAREQAGKTLTGGYIHDSMDGRVGLNDSPPPKGLKSAPLSDDEFEAAVVYRSSAYRDINRQLRGQPIPKKTYGVYIKPNRIGRVVELVDSAFEKVPPTTEPITLYRVASTQRLAPTFQDRAFVSTTYEKDLLSYLEDSLTEGTKGNTVMTIKLPAGSKALKLSGREMNREEPGGPLVPVGESEILLPRNSTFVLQRDGTYLAKTG